ncbi:hypothetical protein RO3G_04099 [Rhizopus delemar RA 99-880]|uniref:Uncharacterized protein n=1 Tax=Rhizopus delemar (strain RA 99-880 / ATCC MYA-4621 / FGSC 9543 / NRRL 43880) TaxID=246409 RepID=I1BT64_RHIO9|nr:hypothetical protein RO3G_04099 [Rhizopus delemar RA 99-880]|eukprot:EIE79394.1 hypothetical protein RO3G_04099 [Rhizopus delemar RA 99-880]
MFSGKDMNRGMAGRVWNSVRFLLEHVISIPSHTYKALFCSSSQYAPSTTIT